VSQALPTELIPAMPCCAALCCAVSPPYLFVQWCCKLFECILEPEAAYAGQQLCGDMCHPHHGLEVTLNGITHTRVTHLGGGVVERVVISAGWETTKV